MKLRKWTREIVVEKVPGCDCGTQTVKRFFDGDGLQRRKVVVEVKPAVDQFPRDSRTAPTVSRVPTM